MAGLVPAIHVFAITEKKDVDARAKRGHDDCECGGNDIDMTSRSRGGIRPSYASLLPLLT